MGITFPDQRFEAEARHWSQAKQYPFPEAEVHENLWMCLPYEFMDSSVDLSEVHDRVSRQVLSLPFLTEWVKAGQVKPVVNFILEAHNIKPPCHKCLSLGEAFRLNDDVFVDWLKSKRDWRDSLSCEGQLDRLLESWRAFKGTATERPMGILVNVSAGRGA